MENWKTIAADGPPPAGIPLIVTVEGGDSPPKLAYPVIYRKSFIRDEWGFYEHGLEDGLIGPEYFKVTAWQVMPSPYLESKSKSHDPITLAEAIHIYENSQLQSKHFSQDGLSAAYALGLSGLYALQVIGELNHERGAISAEKQGEPNGK